MKTLISQFFITYSKPQPFLFHFPNQKNQSFLHISRTKWPDGPRTNRFFSVRAQWGSESASYGGWEDLRPVGGESDQFRKFLSSTGIDDRRHVFVFVLGLVCAFAISRVRVSSIIVVPASVLIFGLGFSVGFVRSGGVGEVSLSGNKRRSKEDDNLVVYIEKLRSLVEVFDGFRVKVDDLKSDIQRAIDSRGITVSDLENYVEEMGTVSLVASDGRKIVEECVEDLARSNVGFAENQKPSKRKKEAVEIGYALWQYIGDLFKEKLADPKPSKVKSNAKRESVEKVGGDQLRGNGSIPNKVGNNEKEMVFDSVDDSVGIANFGHSEDSFDRSALKETGNRRIKLASSNQNMGSEEVTWGPNRITEGKEYNYQNNRLQFTSNGHISSKMGHKHYKEMWESHDSLLDSVDFSDRTKHMETKASFVQEQMLKETDGDDRSSLIRENSEDETYGPQIREERVIHEENFPLDDQLSGNESELPSLSSSSISEDVLFDRYVTEANDLLKQAKDFIKATHNEERAEIVLYRSAKLLSKAITMKPMSLLAVGQLGNTYLLHGEMKLRISRQLRMHLTRSDPSSVEKWIRMQDKITSKDDIASVLITVCEECEELLLEAGRKYRLALSIDGNDVRALYNWGLALTFRAQLIADIGPGAAFDADELFLAAIDKFDAMMSKGNAYAPDALFRWGMALQQRSRLRPSNGKEKVKLLQQAKRLYEDALNMDSNNVQVRFNGRGGLIFASFMTYASEHLATRSFLTGLEDRDATRTTTLTGFHFSVTALVGLVSNASGYSAIKHVPFWELLWFSIVANVSITAMNFSLMLNSVGFYQISKLSMIPVVCVMEWILNNKQYSKEVKMSVVVVVIGVGVCTVTDVKVNLKGFMCACLAVLSTSFQQISIGSLKKKHSVGSFELLSKTAPIQATSLLILGPFIDYILSGTFITDYKMSSGAIAFILLSCSLAVFCNISQYLCIGRFSAVSFQVLGHMKTVCVLTLGWLLFDSELTFKNIMGMILAVVGMVIYSWAVEAEKQSGKPVSHSKTSMTEEEIELLKAGLDTTTVKDVEHGANKV